MSRNLSLVRFFIDYSLMESAFVLAGITTLSNFNENNLAFDEDVLFVVDEEMAQENHLNIIAMCKKHPFWNIIYLSEEIHLDSSYFNALENCHVLRKQSNFFEILKMMSLLQEQNQLLQTSKLDVCVTTRLLNCGFSAGLLGFTYLKEAIMMKVEVPEMKMVEFCDKIARDHHTTSSRVERCMRSALQNCYEKNDDGFESMCITKKPTCLNFISIVASCLISEY